MANHSSRDIIRAIVAQLAIFLGSKTQIDVTESKCQCASRWRLPRSLMRQ